MKQGRILSLCVALVMLALNAPPAAWSAPGAVTMAATAKKSRSPRQFTGTVTALDKSSVTVEKHGKTPKTMTFFRHDDTKLVGDLEKSARVTVYYREEGGRTIATRIVVKPPPAEG